MEDNNITMINRNEVCINTTGDCSTCAIPKIGTCNHDRYHDYLNKKGGGEVSAYAFTKAENTLEITLKVNPEKLIGKTYKEMSELLLKAVIGSNVSVEGEAPFLMEYDKYYDINQDGVIKRASVDEFYGLIVALDVPYIQTDTPSSDSICAPELLEDDEDDVEMILKIKEDENNNMNKGTVIAENIGKSYKQLKEFGLFELMPNGFNIYLDDEDIVKSDDSYYAHFEYSLDECVYKTPNGITLTSEELMESNVTFIGSDPMGDFEVPALWIIPNDAWYEKQKKIDEALK